MNKIYQDHFHLRQHNKLCNLWDSKGVLEDGNYTEFCESVAALLPDHGHLPVPGELRRMAVQTFRKSPTLWERGDAPVSGQRFDDYLRIANLTAEKLRIWKLPQNFQKLPRNWDIFGQNSHKRELLYIKLPKTLRRWKIILPSVFLCPTLHCRKGTKPHRQCFLTFRIINPG